MEARSALYGSHVKGLARPSGLIKTSTRKKYLRAMMTYGATTNGNFLLFGGARGRGLTWGVCVVEVASWLNLRGSSVFRRLVHADNL